MNPLSEEKKISDSLQKRILRATFYFFLSSGILAIGYAGYVFADSRIYEATEIRKLEQAIPLTNPHPPAQGETLGQILVPRLSINAIVIQGDSAANLRHGVAHLSNSPLPGESGNVALAGHRDTFFRPLRDIRIGDRVIFKTTSRSFEYIVESTQVVSPTDLSVLDASSGHQLTLLTCFPFYYVGPAPKRFVVHARELDSIP